MKKIVNIHKDAPKPPKTKLQFKPRPDEGRWILLLTWAIFTFNAYGQNESYPYSWDTPASNTSQPAQLEAGNYHTHAPEPDSGLQELESRVGQGNAKWYLAQKEARRLDLGEPFYLHLKAPLPGENLSEFYQRITKSDARPSWYQFLEANRLFLRMNFPVALFKSGTAHQTKEQGLAESSILPEVLTRSQHRDGIFLDQNQANRFIPHDHALDFWVVPLPEKNKTVFGDVNAVIAEREAAFQEKYPKGAINSRPDDTALLRQKAQKQRYEEGLDNTFGWFAGLMEFFELSEVSSGLGKAQSPGTILTMLGIGAKMPKPLFGATFVHETGTPIHLSNGKTLPKGTQFRFTDRGAAPAKGKVTVDGKSSGVTGDYLTGLEIIPPGGTPGMPANLRYVFREPGPKAIPVSPVKAALSGKPASGTPQAMRAQANKLQSTANGLIVAASTSLRNGGDIEGYHSNLREAKALRAKATELDRAAMALEVSKGNAAPPGTFKAYYLGSGFEDAQHIALPFGFTGRSVKVSAPRPVLPLELEIPALHQMNRTYALTIFNMLVQGRWLEAQLAGNNHHNAVGDPNGAANALGFRLLAAQQENEPDYIALARQLEAQAFDNGDVGSQIRTDPFGSALEDGQKVLIKVNFAKLDSRPNAPKQIRWVLVEGLFNGDYVITDPAIEGSYAIGPRSMETLLASVSGYITFAFPEVQSNASAGHDSRFVITEQRPQMYPPLHPGIKVVAMPPQSYGLEHLPFPEVLGSPNISGFHAVVRTVHDLKGTFEAFKSMEQLRWVYEIFRIETINALVAQDPEFKKNQANYALLRIHALRELFPAFGLEVTDLHVDGVLISDIRTTLHFGGQIFVLLSSNKLSQHEHRYDPENLDLKDLTSAHVYSGHSYEQEDRYLPARVIGYKDGYVIVDLNQFPEPLAIPQSVFQSSFVDGSDLHVLPNLNSVPNLSPALQQTMDKVDPLVGKNFQPYFSSHTILQRITYFFFNTDNRASWSQPAVNFHASQAKYFKENERLLSNKNNQVQSQGYFAGEKFQAEHPNAHLPSAITAFNEFDAYTGGRLQLHHDIIDQAIRLHTLVSGNPALALYAQPFFTFISNNNEKIQYLLQQNMTPAIQNEIDQKLGAYAKTVVGGIAAFRHHTFPKWYLDNFGPLDGSGNAPEPVEDN